MDNAQADSKRVVHIAQIVKLFENGMVVVLEGYQNETSFVLFSDLARMVDNRGELESCKMTKETAVEKWGLKEGYLLVVIFNDRGEIYAARQLLFAGEYYSN